MLFLLLCQLGWYQNSITIQWTGLLDQNTHQQIGDIMSKISNHASLQHDFITYL